MWRYYFLDIQSTITEAVTFYVFLGCFCKRPRFSITISRRVPPVVLTIIVLLLTYFTELGAFKFLVIWFFLTILIHLFYKAAIYESQIVVELFYILLLFSEAVSVLLTSLLYHGEILDSINGDSILKWQSYVMLIVLRYIFLMIAHRWLRSFCYSVKLKDVIPLSVGFLFVFFISFVSTYKYLNLQDGDTLVLDVAVTVLSVYFMIQFLYFKNVSYIREKEQLDKIQIVQLQRQLEFYQEKLRDEERVRSIYHDMKNHLLVLERQNRSPETAEMIEKLQQEVAMYEDYVHTGNAILDIIVKEKAEYAREKHIVFSIAADLNGMDFMESLDVSTIFGNGLDNAVEASEKLPEEQRVILVKAGKIHHFFSVLIENNCVEENKEKKNCTAKQDDFLHGFGISNMEKAVKKYGGQLLTKCNNGKFTLKILIPIP